MRPEQTNIRSRSALMRDEQTGQLYAAGLIWQPLEAGSSRSIGKQIRELASSFNGVFKTELNVAGQNYVGLLQDNSEIRVKEVEKNETFSLAAQVANHFKNDQAIVALELFGALSDLWALVIINEGVPVLDTIVDSHKVADTIATYVCSVGLSAPMLYSNSDKLKEFFKVEFFDLQTLKTDPELKLAPIPKDLVMMAAVVSLVMFMLTAGFIANDYWAEHKREVRLAQLNNKQDLEQYTKVVQSQLGNLGMTAPVFQDHLSALMGYPFVAKGWVLEELSCQQARCKSQ